MAISGKTFVHNSTIFLCSLNVGNMMISGERLLGELNNSKTTYCYSRKGQAIGVRRCGFHNLVEQVSLL